MGVEQLVLLEEGILKNILNDSLSGFVELLNDENEYTLLKIDRRSGNLLQNNSYTRVVFLVLAVSKQICELFPVELSHKTIQAVLVLALFKQLFKHTVFNVVHNNPDGVCLLSILVFAAILVIQVVYLLHRQHRHHLFSLLAF